MQLHKIKSQIKKLNYYDHFPVNIGGYEIEIYHDDWCEDPRAWGSVFTMVCAHGKYDLGDERHDPKGVDNWDENMLAYFAGYNFADVTLECHWISDEPKEKLDQIYRWIDNNVLWLPLYLYDHSGITMQSKAFNSMWDSGQVGFIYITREQARKEWNWDRISSKREEQLYTWMKGEVEIYDHYLRGEVYGYNIEYGDELVDSCSGYYGDQHDDDGYMLDVIGNMIQYHQTKKRKYKHKKLKALIKEGVPFHKRQQIISKQ